MITILNEMKTQIFLAFSILLLCSCHPNDQIDPEQREGYCENWSLVQMTGNVANRPPTTGNDMEWQESILLYSNLTFVKTRERNDGTRQETGTYTIETLTDGKYLTLTYNSENDLIANCIAGLNEVLKFNDTGDKLMGTWAACDGPGLFYDITDRKNCGEN
jgi:hypothetical protein